MTNQEAAQILQNSLNFSRPARGSGKTYTMRLYNEALLKAIDYLRSDLVHAAGGVYCHECYWFDTQGYDNPDHEPPELQMGYCAHWRKDTQACEFCSRGGQ